MAKEEAPVAAIVFALVAGATVFVSGLSLAYMGRWASTMASMMGMGGMMGYWVDQHYTWGILGAVLGAAMIALSILLARKPEYHLALGITIVLLAAFSIFVGMGGWLIGFILGLIGGIVAIMWKPQEKLGK